MIALPKYTPLPLPSGYALPILTACVILLLSRWLVGHVTKRSTVARRAAAAKARRADGQATISTMKAAVKGSHVTLALAEIDNPILGVCGGAGKGARGLCVTVCVAPHLCVAKGSALS